MVTIARTYGQTHPWLTFRLDLSRARPDFWMLLGEARSKCQHVEYSLLTPEVAADLHELFLAKGALATTAIEGNTLSEEDVVKAIEGKLKLPPSQDYLRQEIDNIVAAFRDIASDLLRPGGSAELSRARIEEFNGMVLKDLDLEPDVIPGEVRKNSVGVARYRGAPAEDCEYLLDRLCEWLNSPELQPSEATMNVPYAIIKAVIAHLYLAWIHPFGDGNGRTARLVEHQILLAAGVPTPATHLLSNHYNLTRARYYQELDRSSRAGEQGDVLAFLHYAVEGMVDGLQYQLRLIWKQQFQDRWEQFVYQAFGHTNSETDVRRRRLVLDLSKRDEAVPQGELRRVSPAVAEAYAGKTSKTVTRDVNALLELDLIERVAEGLRPRSRMILAFLPEVRID